MRQPFHPQRWYGNVSYDELAVSSTETPCVPDSFHADFDLCEFRTFCKKSISPVLKTRNRSVVLDYCKRVELLTLRDILKVGHGCKLDVVAPFAKRQAIDFAVDCCASSSERHSTMNAVTRRLARNFQITVEKDITRR